MDAQSKPNRTTSNDFKRPLTRRRFFRHSAAAAGLISTAAFLGGCETGRHRARAAWRCRLAASTILFKDLPLEAACARITALGFEAVDIWSAYDNCPHLDDAADRLGPSGLKALLARHRLALCSFSVYVGGYPKYAGLLGGVGGGVAVRGSGQPCQASELTAKMRAFFESLKPEIDLAEKYSSRLAIENHSNALLDSLDSFKAFVDLNVSSRVGLALAPYHLQAVGASVEEAIRICGRQLLFFYAWQKEPGVAQLPGHGPADFTPWLRALAQTHYGGFVVPFMHGHVQPDAMASALVQSRDYLKRCART